MDYKKFISNKNQVYEPVTYLYQYNDENFRVAQLKAVKKSGFELISKVKNKSTKEEIERVDLSRSRRMIRELALSNSFEYFATLTINSSSCDRFSLTECQERLRKRLKALKRINKDFAYIFITERHKNGAFHFHGLIKGITDFYINNNGYLSHQIFDQLGFNSFSKIRDYTKTCNYILKYITKDCVRNEKGTIYISSRGLKKASRSRIGDIDLDWGYKDDFCKIKDFNLSQTNKEDILKLIQACYEKNF